MTKKKSKTKVETNNESKMVKMHGKSSIKAKVKSIHDIAREIFDTPDEETIDYKNDYTFLEGSHQKYFFKRDSYMEALLLAALIRDIFLTVCSDFFEKFEVEILVTQMPHVVEKFYNNNLKITHEQFKLFYADEFKIAPYVIIRADFPASSELAVSIKNFLDILFKSDKTVSDYLAKYLVEYPEKNSIKDFLLDFLEIISVESFRNDLSQLKFLYNYSCISKSEIRNNIGFLLPQDVSEEVLSREIDLYNNLSKNSEYKYNHPPYLALKEYKVNYSPVDGKDYLSPSFTCALLHLENY